MSTTEVRYPDIEVRLTGTDGNAYALMGKVAAALKAHGVPKATVDEFFAEATAGDYDNLLRTCALWVEVS